ncbi:hypothetical protein MAP00_008999 [Monascus purpureus]|nr:hypothetical protein MAP00_008999 [Monascus purpureus]
MHIIIVDGQAYAAACQGLGCITLHCTQEIVSIDTYYLAADQINVRIQDEDRDFLFFSFFFICLFFPHLSAGLAQMTVAWPLMPSPKFETFFSFSLPFPCIILHCICKSLYEMRRRGLKKSPQCARSSTPYMEGN